MVSAPFFSQIVARQEKRMPLIVNRCVPMLRDKTGIVRVDTKQAGFVVSEVPLHTTMTVSGTVASGSEGGVKATGVRY
jgi:hypothetical protein